MNVTTKKPSLEEGSVELRALGGSFGRYQLQGAVDVPIGDTFGLRFVANYNKSDGYYENGATYGPTVRLSSPSGPGSPARATAMTSAVTTSSTAGSRRCGSRTRT